MLTSMEKHLVQIDSTWQDNLDDIHNTPKKARRQISRNRKGKSVCRL